MTRNKPMKTVSAINNHTQSMPNTRLKYLAASVLGVLSLSAMPVAHADTQVKKIGDLEIYAKPSGSTEPSLLLMLDFSGSMWSTPDPKGVSDNNSVFSIPSQKSVPTDKRLDAGYGSEEGWHKKDYTFAPGAPGKRWLYSSAWAKGKDNTKKACDWGYASDYHEATDTYDNTIYKKVGVYDPKKKKNVYAFCRWQNRDAELGNEQWDSPDWCLTNQDAAEFEYQNNQQIGGKTVSVYFRKKRFSSNRNDYGYYCKMEKGFSDVCKAAFGQDVSTFSEGKSYSYTDPEDSTKTFTVKLPINPNDEIGKDFKGDSLYGNPLYGLTGCQTDTKKTYSRVATLKDALLTLLTTPNAIPKGTRFGLGTYSALTGDYKGNTNPIKRQSRTGTIMVPVKPVTFEHRKLLAEKIANLVPSQGTPTAHALAESGAYMFGTSTMSKSDPLDAQNDGEEIRNSSYFGVALSAERYKDVTTAYESDKTKETFDPATDHYIKGSGDAECAANGIYLMTDGLPGRSSERTLFEMNNSLSGKDPLDTSSGSGLEDIRDKTGWNYMSRYARRLRDGDKNPGGISIKVATAGLGDLFAGMTKEPYVDPDTGKESTRYVCESNLTDTSTDSERQASNLCKLGEKDYGNGYGEGGFSYLTDAKSISDSIQNFIDDLNTTLPTKPSGTIIVPDDPYSTKGREPFAYLPMIESKPAGKIMVWPGNIKKYQIENGTLYGKDDEHLFGGDDGSLNPEAQDLWSDKDYPQKNSNITSGGIYANLKTPKSGLSSVRKVYVEDTVSDKPVLKEFAVDASGKITVAGSALADDSFADTTTYNAQMIGRLLQFLGFNNVTKDDDTNDPKTLVAVDTLTSTDPLTSVIKELSDYNDYTLVKPSEAVRVLGASPHSTPALLSYGATIEEIKDADNNLTGRFKYVSRNDYLLFGSMDGALHLVDADNYNVNNGGQEQFAILTKTMLTAQPEAIVPNKLGEAVGVPKFGVDAPWSVKQKLKDTYTKDSDGAITGGTASPEGDTMAYGGFRMGAEGLYGIDITNNSSPKIEFKLEADKTCSEVTDADGNKKEECVYTGNFARLGQIWNKPTIAKIKTSSSDTGTDVLVFGGGYDSCYEDHTFQIENTNFDNATLTNQRGELCKDNIGQKAVGNAVYIINAKTGDYIWSTNDLSSGKDDIKHSVVGQVLTLDRENDGFMDHLYFADLGGQLFRVDFTNEGTKTYKSDGTEELASGFAAKRIVRLYHDNETDKKYVRRFYERPMVSMQRSSVFNDGKKFTIVNLVSGDRSSPLSKLRNEHKYADRIYGIFDVDVTRPNRELYKQTGFQPTSISTSTEPADLIDLEADRKKIAAKGYQIYKGKDHYKDEENKAKITEKRNEKKRVIKSVIAKQGWYYPFVTFDGYNDVLFGKGVGRSELTGNILSISVYNPNMDYASTADSCSADILGGTEVELYCLPYGVCTGDAFIDGTGGYIRSGRGIQELTLGPRGSSDEHRRQRMIITSAAYTSASLKDKGKNYGDDDKKDNKGLVKNQKKDKDKEGGGSSIPPVTKEDGKKTTIPPISSDNFTLKPKVWYDSRVVDE